MAIAVLTAEGDVLVGHVVPGDGSVGAVVGLARILREVGSAGYSGGSIDGRQQDEIAAGIVDLAAANSQPILVLIEPGTVVEHPAQKALLLVVDGGRRGRGGR